MYLIPDLTNLTSPLPQVGHVLDSLLSHIIIYNIMKGTVILYKSSPGMVYLILIRNHKHQSQGMENVRNG